MPMLPKPITATRIPASSTSSGGRQASGRCGRASSAAIRPCRGARRRGGVTPARSPREEEPHEPAPHAARPRRREATGDGRRDRRRQVRLHVPGHGGAHAGAACRGHRRPFDPPRAGGAGARRLAGGALRRGVARRGARRRRRHDGAGRGCDGADGGAAHRGGGGMHRPSRRRAAPRAGGDRARQACGHGERGGGRAGRAVARGAGAAGGRGLLHGLWRPAGAGVRAGGHAPDHGLPDRRRRQGHEVPAAFPRQHAGHGLGALRADRRAGAAKAA